MVWITKYKSKQKQTKKNLSDMLDHDRKQSVSE